LRGAPGYGLSVAKTRITRGEAVRIVREGAKSRRPFAVLSFRGAVVVVFFVFLVMAVLFGKARLMVPCFYAVMSLITFSVYATDKSAAESNGWRTKERTLHLLELACGWPGALLAQGWLRHKSRKVTYGTVFWLIVAVNLGALLWLMGRRAI
jgi:uncharacterized membrane protein YsdA (DUF1294 family)